VVKLYCDDVMMTKLIISGKCVFHSQVMNS